MLCRRIGRWENRVHQNHLAVPVVHGNHCAWRAASVLRRISHALLRGFGLQSSSHTAVEQMILETSPILGIIGSVRRGRRRFIIIIIIIVIIINDCRP